MLAFCVCSIAIAFGFKPNRMIQCNERDGRSGGSKGKSKLSAHIMLMHFNDAATVAVNNFLKCSKWLISQARIMCWFLILYIRNQLDEMAVWLQRIRFDRVKNGLGFKSLNGHLKRIEKKNIALKSAVFGIALFHFDSANHAHLHADKVN